MKKPTTQRQDQDADLLARVAVFWPLYEDHNDKGEISHACYEKMETMQDFPGNPAPDMGTPERKKWDAAFSRCADASDYHPAYDLWCKAGKDMGAAANAVFAVKAQTVRGAYEKVKIARLATGSMAESGLGEGDADLSCHQDIDAPWIDNALADLERLAGGAV